MGKTSVKKATNNKKNLVEKVKKTLGLKKEKRGRPKKRKGFTLIELLAVIVILGLLMAIAIPSVTRYINNSRKNSLTATIDNYITAMMTEINNLTYTFTQSNVIYAVPIECLAVERGGTNPFGSWHQANDNYWAYVLVQYDEKDSRYLYGFTFKDNVGYGLYPTVSSKIIPNGSQIKIDLNLLRPKTGKITTITTFENWEKSGFMVDGDTKLQVLRAESEGVTGDGINTCTLAQKGSNYDEVEEEKEKEELLKVAYALILDNSSNEADAKPMIFVRSKEEIKVNDVYTSATYGDKKVLYVYKGFDTATYTFNGSSSNTPWISQAQTITSVVVEDKIKPVSTAGWFTKFSKTLKYDLNNLDMSLVQDMSYMFYAASNNTAVKEVSITGLSNWNTSNVTNMTGTFSQYGRYLTNWSLGDISKWSTSKVKTTEGMFAQAGLQATNWNLNLSGWDVSSLENMSYMFAEAGKSAIKTFALTGLENWQPTKVNDMSFMFYSMSKLDYQIDLSRWQIKNTIIHDYYNEGSNTKIIPPASFN